jgi:hypothetical protein
MLLVPEETMQELVQLFSINAHPNMPFELFAFTITSEHIVELSLHDFLHISTLFVVLEH